MDLSFEKKEKIVGLFMVLVVTMLLGIVVMVGRAKDWFETYIHYYTVFDEGYNLAENARVKLYKADIGKVVSVKLVGDKVKVELAILEDYATRMRADSVATVESPTFIGSEYVSIKPGSPEALILPENGMILSKPKKSVADVMEEFEVEKTAKKVIKAIQDLAETMALLRDPEGPLFSALGHTSRGLENIEAVTRNIRDGKGSLGKLIHGEDLFQEINGRLDQVQNILKGLEQTSSNAQIISKNIEHASEEIPNIVDGLKKSIAILNQALVNIETGSRDVPAVTKSTRQGIKEFRDGVGEIRDGVEGVDKVVKSLQKNFFIRKHIPPLPQGKAIDKGLRQ